MKKIQFFILSAAILLFLTACRVLFSPSETEQGETTPAETHDASKEDHPILSDYLTAEPHGTHEVRILFVNVGKADAILLEIDGKRYMIDAGTTDSVPALLTALAYMDWNAIDGLFVTHAHNDHVGGADELCGIFPVGAYYVPAISENMRKLTAPALAHGIMPVLLKAGAVVPLSDGVFFEVFAPYRYNPGDDNNNSLVLKLRVNGVSVLFASDMLYDEEKTLLNGNFDLSADILKVGHHGRRDATSVKFLEAVSPKTAVISTDSKEEPDSPHESILGMLDDLDAEVYVTEDTEVGILVTLDPDGTYRVDHARIERKTDAELEIVAVSADEQTVEIRNRGEHGADLGGFFLFSKEGSEIFVFPENTVLASGEKICIAGKDSPLPADFIWDETRPWSQTKKDTAVLYDQYGNILDKKIIE